MVANPHFCWWVDVIGYIFTGTWPVGNARYLGTVSARPPPPPPPPRDVGATASVWPETQLLEKLSTTHHAWFIPLCLICTRGTGGIPWEAIYKWSFWTTAALSIVARSFSPHSVVLADNTTYVLNISTKAVCTCALCIVVPALRGVA
jgi:hypothetical protein